MFHHFAKPLEGERPLCFTYPFCYEPHPWVHLAMEEVVAMLRLRQWPTAPKGKMFGVLVVEDVCSGVVGYLVAYSGSYIDCDDDYFVPSIYVLPKDSIPTSREESKRLQDNIFSQYEMLNAEGDKRNLLDIFADTPLRYPPSGSGDCCAPKLLQYAFSKGFYPLCMAEFWWGESPKDEIRHHLSCYPACTGRCKPILDWMLRGLNVDTDPQNIYDQSLEEQLRIVYDDEWLMIVNKPSGMLSVPGKIQVPCVIDVLRQRLGITTFAVHRLDMYTSGLQLLVKGEQTQKIVQQMFEHRQVSKSYVALLEGEVQEDRGEIRLPLSSDYLNRPCQHVDFVHGKNAVTLYDVVWRKDGRTLVKLYPHTGRTHQLRVHCASREGLGCPIVGDALYGHCDKRLCLQAQSLEFIHPITGDMISVSLSDIPFSGSSDKL